jgi:integrase
MKASISFYPNASKKSPKTGKTPIYMRICIRGRKSETRTNAELTSEQLGIWDPITQRVAVKGSPINTQLNKLEGKFSDFLGLNATNLSTFNANQIKDFVLGYDKTKESVSVMKFVDDYFIKSLAHNVNRASATVKNYRRAINHFRKFLESRKETSLIFEDLDYNRAADFGNYLVNSNPAIDKKGMTEVSASTVIKKFRTIFTHAEDRGLLAKNPFNKIRLNTKSPKKERLTIDMIRQIKELDLSQYEYQQVYRDIFLFCVFTGLAYQDSMDLTWNNLQKQKNGEYKLSIQRLKTGTLTEMFVPSFAMEIANKYRNFISNEDPCFVLPRRSNKEINSQYKFLAHLAKNPIRITTHTSRHTFRQIIGEAGIEGYSVIKRMMGQTQRGDLDEIYYSITESTLLAAKNKLELYLHKHL